MINDSSEITEKQRQAFRGFMQKHGLTANGWAKKAGIAEATIRHYLAGRNHSITSVNLERLAQVMRVKPDDIMGNTAPSNRTKNETFTMENISLPFDFKKFKVNEVAEIHRDLFIQAYVDFERLKIISESATSRERANAIFSWYQLSQIYHKIDRGNLNLEELKELFTKVALG